MVKRSNSKLVAALSALMVLGMATLAHGYGTKLHMVTAQHLANLAKQHRCNIPIKSWNTGAFKANSAYWAATKKAGLNQKQKTTKTVRLSKEICDLISNPKTSQYFVSCSTGPDTFPGMFGNTDPTHALFWNTSWQSQVLWQNAKTGPEKACALGWMMHVAGDLNAHGLANTHAGGYWLSPADPLGTVWKHVMAEWYYNDLIFKFPKGFNNKLVWPETYIKKMFFNPNSPIYRHWDFLWNKYINGPDSAKIGMVAKVFFGALRTIFLLWDFHAKKMHVWKGHTDYYKPKKNTSVSNYLHWLFADQAMNFHAKKVEAAKKVLDTWYEACHRAQQSIVADKGAKFTGAVGWDKIYYTFGKKRVTKNYYKASGPMGAFDAYKYLTSALMEYLSPDLITITKDNFPTLRKILDALKKVGAAAVGIVDAIKAALAKVKEFLLAPVKMIGELLKKMFHPLVEKIQYYHGLIKQKITDAVACSKMPGMCKAVKAQMKSFALKPKNLTSYMNWPIYRNTVTIAALMLEQLSKVNRNSGAEYQSPLFGWPTGDIACVESCVKVYRDNWKLFMPNAGKYFASKSISASMPDYCTVGGDRRRNSPLNEKFKNMTNDQINFGYTCIRKTSTSSGFDPYQSFTQKVPTSISKYKLGSLLQDMIKAIQGRWTFTTHPATRDRSSIEPYQVTPYPAIRGENRIPPKGISSDFAFRYKALKWDGKTIAGAVPNPAMDNKKYYKKTSYSFKAMVGKLLDGIKELLNMALNAIGNWIKKKFNQIKDKVTDAAKKVAAKVKAAADKAKKWVSDAGKKIKGWFQGAWNSVKNFVSDTIHKFHSLSKCKGEAKKLGQKSGTGTASQAKSRADQFWSAVWSSIKDLTPPDRRKAVESHWNSLKSQLAAQITGNRNSGRSKVRKWAIKGSSKNKIENEFKKYFDSSAKVDWNAYYNKYLKGNAPAPKAVKKAAPKKTVKKAVKKAVPKKTVKKVVKKASGILSRLRKALKKKSKKKKRSRRRWR